MTAKSKRSAAAAAASPLHQLSPSNGFGHHHHHQHHQHHFTQHAHHHHLSSYTAAVAAAASATASNSTGTANNTSSPSSSSEPRRANKPLMEKRRRARINQSLAALKTLILDSAKSDNTKHAKLEKADILELTVRHFQRHRSIDVAGVHQYRAGYADCVREVQRYLDTPDAHTMTLIDAGVRQRLLRHLDSCVTDVDMDLKMAAVAAVDGASSVLPSAASTSGASSSLTPLGLVAQSLLENSNASSTASSAGAAAVAALSHVDELNNNGVAAALASSLAPPPSSSASSSSTPLTTLPEFSPHGNFAPKMVKTYDGNLVFVLPSHYLQLASALGINLRPQPMDGIGPAGVGIPKLSTSPLPPHHHLHHHHGASPSTVALMVDPTLSSTATTSQQPIVPEPIRPTAIPHPTALSPNMARSLTSLSNGSVSAMHAPMLPVKEEPDDMRMDCAEPGTSAGSGIGGGELVAPAHCHDPMMAAGAIKEDDSMWRPW